MKNLKKLGKALNKAEQKKVLGGGPGLTHVQPEGSECIEGMCNAMPNPDWNQGSTEFPTGPNQNGNVFVQGVCRDGLCYYS